MDTQQQTKMSLDEYLFRKKISVKEFADAVGCTRTQMSRIRHGHVNPHKMTRLAIIDKSGGMVDI